MNKELGFVLYLLHMTQVTLILMIDLTKPKPIWTVRYHHYFKYVKYIRFCLPDTQLDALHALSITNTKKAIQNNILFILTLYNLQEKTNFVNDN